MKICVIGGGINGVMIAWEFARSGHTVDLYEKGELIGATSRASTKMLHGGLRYLEHGHWQLVREALLERAWWISQAPQLTKKIEILLPVFRGSGRSRWTIGIGVKLYETLAIGSNFPRGRWRSATETRARLPALKANGLIGSFSYWDGQMDDYHLGLWAANQARESGATFYTGTRVTAINASTGEVFTVCGREQYDRIVNAAGPWANQVLSESSVPTKYQLDLVRGSHLVVDRKIDAGCVFQVPLERRVIFVLPYDSRMLIGTTEVRQSQPDTAGPGDDEVDYLLKAYNHFHSTPLTPSAIADQFSGVRPIVSSGTPHSRASRESALERTERLINVFGGKWTTSRALAKSVFNFSIS